MLDGYFLFPKARRCRFERVHLETGRLNDAGMEERLLLAAQVFAPAMETVRHPIRCRACAFRGHRLFKKSSRDSAILPKMASCHPGIATGGAGARCVEPSGFTGDKHANAM
ncbi:hypothetical protein [Microvirga sp. TS319]|uniref:hypothetical protein n=1 Tax=Microvirga sp. TS319 TaxID=3241165 RepID=UPI00351AAE74